MSEKLTIEDKIKIALENFRPHLQADGGDVQFVSWNDKTGIAEISLLGMCTHCPMAQTTVAGISEGLKKAVKEIKEVKLV